MFDREVDPPDSVGEDGVAAAFQEQLEEWYSQAEARWGWRVKTEGRRIEGSAATLKAALEDVTKVALAHGAVVE